MSLYQFLDVKALTRRTEIIYMLVYNFQISYEYTLVLLFLQKRTISFSMLVYSVLLLYMLWLWFHWCQDKVLIASRKVSFCLVIIIALHNCTSLKTFTIQIMGHLSSTFCKHATIGLSSFYFIYNSNVQINLSKSK